MSLNTRINLEMTSSGVTESVRTAQKGFDDIKNKAEETNSSV
jgi:hypothetical protein